MKQGRARVYLAVAMGLLCIAATAFWQRQALTRLAIADAAASFVHVRVSFASMHLTTQQAVFENVRVTSLSDEPIATIARLWLTYDLRDLLPGGKRLYGLKSVTVASPSLTIVRHADGSFNVPRLKPPASNARVQKPLMLRAVVRNGSIEVVNESQYAKPNERRMYVEDLDADADIASSERSHYAIAMQYGERPERLYPVRGRGEIDLQGGYIDQRWTSAELPIAAAANFVINAPSLRLDSGMLHSVDAQYFALGAPGGTLAPHLAARAMLTGASLSVAGLSQEITGVRGPVDVYENGLLTPGLAASVGGALARIDGGIYDVRDPHVRITIRGAGDLARLREVFAQAARLPMRGRLAFGLLIEGSAAKPLIWIDLRAPAIAYASTSVQRIDGLVAYDGREADIVAFNGSCRGIGLTARGRVIPQKQPDAIALLLGVHAAPGDLPYTGTLLPQFALDGTALATANDPKSIALRGVISGAGPNENLEGIFNVASSGEGAVGPLRLRHGAGTLYARIALDRPRDLAVGLARVQKFSIPQADGSLNATLFGGEGKSTIGVLGIAQIATTLGVATAQGRLASRGNALQGGIFGRLNSEASFGARVDGTLHAPKIAGTVVVAGARYRDFEVNGSAGLAFAGGTLDVSDAQAALGPLFIGAAGTVTGILPGTSAPQYDLAAELHTSDVSALLAQLRPREAALVQGSVDADLHVRGAGMQPSFAGTVSAPEGLVNGLAFRGFHGSVRGDRDALALQRGHVTVGSTNVALAGSATTSGNADVNVRAPQADLADFNDFFDRGDTLAGNGSLALSATTSGTQLIATSGTAFFTGAQYRRLALGTVVASWRSIGDSIGTNVSLGGTSGLVHVSGTVMPAVMQANLRAQATNVDLGAWLPMLGLNLPVTGRLNAQTSISGRYPDIAMNLRAAVANGTAGRIPIERFDVAASVSHGRGRITSAALDVPSLATTASGTFGLRPGDRLALVAHSTSPNVGYLLNEVTGKDFKLAGTLDSMLQLSGTRTRPQLSDTVTLQALQYANLTIPRIAGVIAVDRTSASVREGQIDLARGKALVAVTVPIAVTAAKVGPGRGRFAASLTADDIELSNFVSLLPKGTQIEGRIDGTVIGGGSVDAPQVNGSLTLHNASFSGPMERSPITDVAGELAFSGTRASLQSRGSVGAGSLTAQATAALASLREPASAAFDVTARLQNARLDMPAYFQGVLNGSVALTRADGAIPQMSGDMTVSDARLPLSAFLNVKGGSKPPPSLPEITFANLRIAAGKNVRVQSANVDVGATGDVALSGALRAPKLAGSFRSTGGTLSFYRTFNLETANLDFDPSSGLVPDVNAVATSYVANPPTAVRMHVTGPVTNMNLDLSSDPSYNKQQILGLLVGAQQFGAVAGVNSTGGTGFSATSAGQQFALGQVNTLFTRTMLEPLSASVASAFGFTSVQITTDIQTGLGLNALKALGKNVNAIFAQSFGYPRVQAVTLEAHPDPATGYRLTWYTTTGPSLFAAQLQMQPVASNVLDLNPATTLPPASGTNGVGFSYVRKFP